MHLPRAPTHLLFPPHHRSPGNAGGAKSGRKASLLSKPNSPSARKASVTKKTASSGSDPSSAAVAPTSRYEGEFAMDGRMGTGTWTGLRLEDGETSYTGAWAGDMRAGEGVAEYKDGTKYEGAFQVDYRSGHGVATYANGDMYVGAWEGGKRQGLGTLSSSNGTVYHGAWVDDAPHVVPAQWVGLQGVADEMKLYLDAAQDKAKKVLPMGRSAKVVP